jgi:uncharacterized membrane protein YeaQ/YmgE (transglycosylase-associated protein family)
MLSRDPDGFGVTAIIGIVGAVIGGSWAHTRLIRADPVDFVMALAGATNLLLVGRALPAAGSHPGEVRPNTSGNALRIQSSNGILLALALAPW